MIRKDWFSNADAKAARRLFQEETCADLLRARVLNLVMGWDEEVAKRITAYDIQCIVTAVFDLDPAWRG